MKQDDAFTILWKINALLASQGNTQQVQSYVAQLEAAGYPLTATIKNKVVVRYRPDVSARRTRGAD